MVFSCLQVPGKFSLVSVFCTPPLVFSPPPPPGYEQLNVYSCGHPSSSTEIKMTVPAFKEFTPTRVQRRGKSGNAQRALHVGWKKQRKNPWGWHLQNLRSGVCRGKGEEQGKGEGPAGWGSKLKRRHRAGRTRSPIWLAQKQSVRPNSWFPKRKDSLLWWVKLGLGAKGTTGSLVQRPMLELCWSAG